MTLFRLDASIRIEGSHSRAIADIVEQEWRVGHPGDAIVRRHVGTEPIAATTWGTAAFAGYTPEDQRTNEQREALRLAATLADELIAADAYLFAVPLYNFGVSQHFKTWVDTVLTDPRFGPTGPSPIAGRPAVLVTVQGGNYSAGTPREGWDHATGWMQRILADVWNLDLDVVEAPFTLVGVNPALDEFKDVAAGLRADADALATKHGQALAAPRS
ncbi:ACP phosphodiesterase [Williamsia sp. 1138]|uniref:FMN-dependent NADH-azoreductase n=1 Tax=Williamsia sp. 1138 TaxID=1903117 RepID=UPI000A103319|nr:NAD(P)H-dependent oxidoreductase [Williamsia sp. 1138]OZG27750.1 ACP phosphodiesterase [Williamsia sp. 1138]